MIKIAVCRATPLKIVVTRSDKIMSTSEGHTIDTNLNTVDTFFSDKK
jgi:hypothetical protein